MHPKTNFYSFKNTSCLNNRVTLHAHTYIYMYKERFIHYMHLHVYKAKERDRKKIPCTI